MTEPDIIKYANCWEDADLLLASVPDKANQCMLSIASGGDNSFSLLTKNPSKVVLVDMNQSQLHLCALKKAAFSTLTHEQLLEFLGFSYSNQRKELYELVKHELSDEARIYWDARLAVIVNGLIYSGKFEQYFKLFREKVLPWIHNDKKIIRLLFPKNAFQQECYYFDVWNSWRWRFLFKIFFSKTVMGRFGRTKEYLNQVEVPVGEFIFKQAEQHLIDDACQENYFLHFIFLGWFFPKLPHYLREENFETIKSQLHKIEWVHGTAQEALEQYESFDFCNFSNIFEYMDKTQFQSFEALLRKKTKSGSVVSYWNLMVDRMFSELDAARYKPQKFDIVDKGFFYKRFVSEEID